MIARQGSASSRARVANEAIAVLGAGAWGTALANLCAREGRPVFLWARDREHVAEMRATRRNARRAPGVELAFSVEPTDDLARAVGARVTLAVTPTQTLRAVAASARPHTPEGADWIVCAKGIERGSDAFLSDVLSAVLPQAHPACLSGPSFAHDVSQGLPTAVTLAAREDERAERLCRLIAAPHFRLYRTTDLRGVEVGGAAKNVLAIACGVAAGRGLGASAGAALTARGFAELSRFGAAFGARPETLMGLSGLGDLVLSCGSLQSRNFAFGHALGAGATLQEAAGGKLAEGAFTARALAAMARDRGVDMPIANVVDRLVAGALDVNGAIDSLMTRPLKAES